MQRPIVNLDELEFREHGNGANFEAKIGDIAGRLGARKLGYNLVVLPPGKKAWPYHLHHINEEMFLVLAGEGTLRYDGKDFPLRKGDVICAPPGPESAHQIINTSDCELRYLALSSKDPHEIAEYPDSGKIGLKSLAADGQGSQRVSLRLLSDPSEADDYWQGES